MAKRYLAFLLPILTLVTCNHLQAVDNYILITCLYNEENHQRQEEYLECLKKNMKHQLIKKIHITYDVSTQKKPNSFLETVNNIALQSSKVTITPIKQRQTYGDLFNIANSLYKNERIIIANADIYFNNTLDLLSDLDLANSIVTLTRWEPDSNGKMCPLKHKTNGSPIWGSQDVWIFKSPIKQFPGWEIPLGLQMCDHKIAFQMLKAGFDMVNPCLDVQSIHVHQSEVRHWYHDRSRSLAYSAFIPWCKSSDIKKSAQDHWVMS